VRTFDRGDEAVSQARTRFDVRCAVSLRAEDLSQPADGLDDAVVGDGDAAPGLVGDGVFGDGLPGVGGQQEEDIELPVVDEDRIAAPREAPARRIEFERAEAVGRTLRTGLRPGILPAVGSRWGGRRSIFCESLRGSGFRTWAIAVRRSAIDVRRIRSAVRSSRIGVRRSAIGLRASKGGVQRSEMSAPKSRWRFR
jgi:hypothetical protein